MRMGQGRAACVVHKPFVFRGREGVVKTSYPRHPLFPPCFSLLCIAKSGKSESLVLDSGEKGGKAVNNEYILSYGARTTNPKTRTEGRRPEQPTNRARTATRAQGEGLSFVTKAHPTEVEGMTSLMPGLSGIAEPVRSVFSHACAVCTLCLLLFVLSGSW